MIVSGSCRHILKGRLVEKLPSYAKILTLRKESNRNKQPQKGLQKKDFGDSGASLPVAGVKFYASVSLVFSSSKSSRRLRAVFNTLNVLGDRVFTGPRCSTRQRENVFGMLKAKVISSQVQLVHP